MIETKGDFWSYFGNAHVIPTNGNVTTDGRCVMGRGIALQARNRFIGLDKYLGLRISTHGNHVHFLGTWPEKLPFFGSYTLFSFPVKHNYWEMASLALIRRSVEELIETVSVGFERVIMVRPGCGNGGRRWTEVKPILEPYLNDRFIIVDNAL